MPEEVVETRERLSAQIARDRIQAFHLGPAWERGSWLRRVGNSFEKRFLGGRRGPLFLLRKNC